MVHVRFINDKEPVMGELACPDIDGRVLVVMSVKVEPELRSYTLRVDSGRYSRLPFAQHEQHALINIVVNEYKRLSGRLDKIRSEFIGIEDLAVEEDALYRGKGCADKEIDFIC